MGACYMGVFPGMRYVGIPRVVVWVPGQWVWYYPGYACIPVVHYRLVPYVRMGVILHTLFMHSCGSVLFGDTCRMVITLHPT